MERINQTMGLNYIKPMIEKLTKQIKLKAGK